MMCIYNIIFKYCCLKRTKTKNKIKNVICRNNNGRNNE